MRWTEELTKDELIESLLTFGYMKTEDGKQLYELSSKELKEIYEMEVRLEHAVQIQETIVQNS